MAYIYRSITYPSYSTTTIGSCSVHAEHGKGYQRAEPIPYTDEELDALDTKEQFGVLYIEVK